jgi:hypothetical protein
MFILRNLQKLHAVHLTFICSFPHLWVRVSFKLLFWYRDRFKMTLNFCNRFPACLCGLNCGNRQCSSCHILLPSIPVPVSVLKMYSTIWVHPDESSCNCFRSLQKYTDKFMSVSGITPVLKFFCFKILLGWFYLCMPLPTTYGTVQFTLTSVIAEILVRVRIHGSVPHGSGSLLVCGSGSRNKEFTKSTSLRTAMFRFWVLFIYVYFNVKKFNFLLRFDQDPDPLVVKTWIRIRIDPDLNSIRIRN